MDSRMDSRMESRIRFQVYQLEQADLPELRNFAQKVGVWVASTSFAW